MSANKGLEALVTLSSKHLGPGSVCPPMGIGVLRCYSMRYCPFAQRTLLVLLAKNVKHEIINVNLQTKPDWLFEKNPMGKVPILEKDGKVVYESLITCEMLEDMYPNPALYPSNPWEKARDRLFIDRFSSVSNAWFKLIFSGGDSDRIATSTEDLYSGLDIFEEELKNRGTKFFFGERPGMLDYMIWPWCERFTVAQEFLKNTKFISEDRFPVMLAWIESMMQDCAVIGTYLPPDAHLYFLSTFSAKTMEIKQQQASNL